MIAVDTNVLVYAHREDSTFHETASRYLTELAEGPQTWAIPWPCVHEFLAIVTHPAIYSPPTPLKRALEQVGAWLESPTLRLLTESELYWPTLRTLLANGRIFGPKIHDARIAALCKEHHVRELWSADRDFSRLQVIAVRNPLVQTR